MVSPTGNAWEILFVSLLEIADFGITSFKMIFWWKEKEILEVAILEKEDFTDNVCNQEINKVIDFKFMAQLKNWLN